MEQKTDKSSKDVKCDIVHEPPNLITMVGCQGDGKCLNEGKPNCGQCPPLLCHSCGCLSPRKMLESMNMCRSCWLTANPDYTSKCPGNGECFIQVSMDPGYERDKTCKCDHDCQLCPCPDCGEQNPQCVNDCFEGKCSDCAVVTHAGWKGKGYCRWCTSTEKIVPPTEGYSLKTSDYNDWNPEWYHELCFIRMKMFELGEAAECITQDLADAKSKEHTEEDKGEEHRYLVSRVSAISLAELQQNQRTTLLSEKCRDCSRPTSQEHLKWNDGRCYPCKLRDQHKCLTCHGPTALKNGKFLDRCVNCQSKYVRGAY